ncbi:MAG: hypothetical protein HOI80_03750 [Alphaproteobacteria bacterium]|jgi:hypothetical protein|nr:hypothetical protein [Alphaproteobacteria bacterium]MBT5390311.1 hypothetical protein [Alphaproteobacteria bacterium]MBT5540289.1 hypothetical protein [Alphaproteobacteria bacterium]MBT5654599.1 hypothetical protein [Alphaproteobacteria bacterium]
MKKFLYLAVIGALFLGFNANSNGKGASEAQKLVGGDCGVWAPTKDGHQIVCVFKELQKKIGDKCKVVTGKHPVEMTKCCFTKYFCKHTAECSKLLDLKPKEVKKICPDA